MVWIGLGSHHCSRTPGGAMTDPLQIPFSKVSTILVLAAIGLAPTSRVEAQEFHGVVLDQETGVPVPSVFVRLVDTAGRPVAASMTDSLGAFSLAAPASGAFTVRLQGLGYRTQEIGPFSISGMTRRTFMLTPDPISVPELVVRGTPQCVVDSERATETAETWERIRQAIRPAAFLTRERALRYDVIRFTRRIEPDSTGIRSEDLRQSQLMEPFHTLSPDSLLAGGFVREDGDTLIYYMPDLDVLLSPAFLNAHCFGVSRKPDQQSVLGFTFEPVADGRPSRRGDPRTAGLRGVFWIDAESGSPLSLDYEYSREHDNKSLGVGHAEFQQLIEGLWVIRDWTISMPRFRERRRILGLFRSTEIHEIVEEGGQVVDVRTEGGFRLTETHRGELVGEVLDSIHGTLLAGAVVRISGTNWQDTTDVAGKFQIRDVGRGDYLVAFSHPFLDTLGIPDPSRKVQAPTDQPVLLGVPSRATVLRSFCPGFSAASIRGVLWGVAQDGTGPVSGVKVEVSFELNGVPNRGAAITGDTGSFRFCEVPPGEITVRATKGDLIRSITLSMPEKGFVRLDIDIAGLR